MKIAIITSRYPSEKKPYNHMFVHMRIKVFLSQSEDVDVFVPSRTNSEYIFEGVKVRMLSSKKIVKFLKDYDVLYLHLLHMYPLIKIDGWPIYKAIMQENYPFAIYLHGSESSYFKDRFFGDCYDLKDIFSMLRKDFYHMPRLKRFLCKAKSQMGPIITPSKWMKDQVENTFGISCVHAIPNGIDVNMFSFQCNTAGNKLIAIRPLGDKVYDIESTIRLMSLLPERYTLDIFGEGRYKKNYEMLITDLGLNSRVKIIDNFIERSRMTKLFRQYNIFISTTKLDTQGITMLEAMSCGLLVASIDNTSKKEFIQDMENGLLANNISDLAAKILNVNSNRSLFEKIVSKGNESMQKIDVSITCNAELSILKNHLNRCT